MTRLTEAALREPLRELLSVRPPRKVAVGRGVPCGVLLPLFERDGEAHVWLTRKPSSMRNHSGQVALPGGKCDPRETTLETALREAHEEIGLDPSLVDVLGPLDEYVTITHFVMTPHVAWIPADAALSPNVHEVARLFAAPLSTFLAPRTGVFPFRGWTFDGELVWGATAAVMKDFAAIVRSLVA